MQTPACCEGMLAFEPCWVTRWRSAGQEGESLAQGQFDDHHNNRQEPTATEGSVGNHLTQWLHVADAGAEQVQNNEQKTRYISPRQAAISPRSPGLVFHGSRKAFRNGRIFFRVQRSAEDRREFSRIESRSTLMDRDNFGRRCSLRLLAGRLFFGR